VPILRTNERGPDLYVGTQFSLVRYIFSKTGKTQNKHQQLALSLTRIGRGRMDDTVSFTLSNLALLQIQEDLRSVASSHLSWILPSSLSLAMVENKLHH
jgi:hypothetical protein